MKNIALTLTAALLATAAHASNVQQDVSAKVENVCVYTQNGVNINSSGFVNSRVDMGTYKATGDTLRKDVGIYNIKCTAGANFKVTVFSAEAGKAPLTLALGGNFSTKDAQLQVTAENVVATITKSDGSNTSADVYSRTIDLKAAAGQWGVKAGNYSGILSYGVEYN